MGSGDSSLDGSLLAFVANTLVATLATIKSAFVKAVTYFPSKVCGSTVGNLKNEGRFLVTSCFKSGNHGRRRRDVLQGYQREYGVFLSGTTYNGGNSKCLFLGIVEE